MIIISNKNANKIYNCSYDFYGLNTYFIWVLYASYNSEKIVNCDPCMLNKSYKIISNRNPNFGLKRKLDACDLYMAYVYFYIISYSSYNTVKMCYELLEACMNWFELFYFYRSDYKENKKEKWMRG